MALVPRGMASTEMPHLHARPTQLARTTERRLGLYKLTGHLLPRIHMVRMMPNATIAATTTITIITTTTITIPVSKIKPVDEVIADPLVERRLLHARDPVTGTRITLAPPPNLTPFLDQSDRQLSFPPRFGEQNKEIYAEKLGYSEDELAHLKENGVI